MVEDTGGKIDLDALPVGDPTLICIKKLLVMNLKSEWDWLFQNKHIETLNKIADRERSPMYTVGDVTGDDRFTFESKTKGDKPMDLAME